MPTSNPSSGKLTTPAARPACNPLVQRALAFKLAQAERLEGQWLVSRRRTEVIHGDFHLGNIVLGPDGVTAVLDFDLARAVPPGYEVVRGLLYCVGPAGGAERFAPRVLAFLDGYLTAAPLGADEVETMVRLYRAVQIADVHGLDVCEGADPATLDFGVSRLALLRWLDCHGDALTALARTARASRRPQPAEAEVELP